jgi:uncharacterized protein YgiM (DUF1202 family)
MKLKRHIILFLMVIASLLALTTNVFAQDDAGVRFIHAIPGRSAVDVYVNNQLAVADLSFGEASAYISVPVGTLEISATAVGSSDVLMSQTATVEAGTATSMIATSNSTPRFDPIVDDRRELAFGNTRFSIVHGIEDGPAVDVIFLADGTAIAEGLAYGASLGTFDVPANVYELAVVPTGGDVSASIADLSLALSASTTNIVLVYGTADAPQALVASAPTSPNNDSGLVRFAHAVLGAAPVDVIINGSLIVPSLAFEAPSEHLTVPAGSHEVSLSINDTEIASLTLDVITQTAQTVVALGSPADLLVSAFSDDLSGLNADSALVSIINAIPDSTIDNLTLADGTSIAAGLAFNSASSSSNIDAGSQAFSMELTVGEDSGTVTIPASMFYGGSYYNILALPGNAFTGPQLLAVETSILRGLGDAGEVMTEQPAVDASGGSEVVVAATPAPVVVTSDDEDVFTARINLNPDANLQLRQYPSSEALSLGLAPSGSSLAVIGRRGPSEYFEGEPADEPVDLSGFGDEDPAEGLDEFDDLLAEDTWLFVTFSTPDGGAINAWVSAQYLQVFDNEGGLARLADIPLTRQNEAGESVATAITPPSESVDRVSVVVYNLDPGVQLNLRRTKGTDGEVIARVEVGTVMAFLGIDKKQEWVFAEYLSADGGAITGWVSFQYVQLQLNGELSDLEEIEDEDETLIVIIDDDTRGEIRGDAERPALPTPDPLEDAVVGEVFLDAGASLQLRRTPDIEGESLDLIPSGTRLIVTGITRNNDWFNVTFEEVEGWVSSQYLVLSFNGEFSEISDIRQEIEVFSNSGAAQN